MVSGHVREIKGQYHIVLSYMDGNGKRESPSFSTNLPVKGNKKRAEKLLQLLQENFVIPKNDEELKSYMKFIKYQLKFGFEDTNISRDEPIQSVEKNFLFPLEKKLRQGIVKLICCLAIICHTGWRVISTMYL